VVVDLLLPQRCVVCGRSGVHVCPACADALRRIRAPLCARCGAPTAWPVARCRECVGRRLAFSSARAAVEYDDAARDVVTAWKERGLRRLGGWAAGIVVAVLPRPCVDFVTFVPADESRRLRRGHHSAERLAAALAVSWELPLDELLGRTRPVARQRGLDHVARRRNVRGAFAGKGRIPRRVLLVDDVYTTGATANAAASALRSAGAHDVAVATFARAIRVR
jgi:predicted amidophosphoribosyltransferase